MSDTNVIDDSALDAAAGLIRESRRLLAFVGAGLSAESGIPTFRGTRGAYSDPAIAKYVQVDTFDRQRDEMLGWYQDRRDELRRVWPNRGHYALARLGLHSDLVVATQNVDGLVEQAAEEEEACLDVLHLHGQLDKIQCHDCRTVFSGAGVSLRDAKPCKLCGGPMRPAVTWFGEDLPAGVWEQAMRRASRSDVCLLIGTSGLVYPAAMIPDAAQESGAKVIEINPSDTVLSGDADILLRGSAAVVLPELVKRVCAV